MRVYMSPWHASNQCQLLLSEAVDSLTRHACCLLPAAIDASHRIRSHPIALHGMALHGSASYLRQQETAWLHTVRCHWQQLPAVQQLLTQGKKQNNNANDKTSQVRNAVILQGRC